MTETIMQNRDRKLTRTEIRQNKHLKETKQSLNKIAAHQHISSSSSGKKLIETEIL